MLPELGWLPLSPFVAAINPIDVALFKWLVVHLDAKGVFDQEEKILTYDDKEQLKELNKIILSGFFKLYTSAIIKGDIYPFVFLVKSSIISKMRAAGYMLVQDYNFLSQYYFLEFKRKI